MTDRHNSEQTARRELKKLRHEGDALGGVFARWVLPRNVDSGDAIEVWGTRIGRSLSVVALIVVGLYLLWVYIR